MKIRSLIALSLCLSIPSFATDYAFIIFNPPWDEDYSLTDQSLHWHLEADFRKIAPAKFRKPHSVKDSKLHYTDAYGAAYYNYFVDSKNAISGQLGYSYMGLHWNENPRFIREDFHLGVASIAWISNSMDKWRWIINAGTTVDATTFDYWESGVFYGMVWGRYSFADYIGIHAGLFGYAGVGTGYALPIFGMDWTPNRHWRVNAIFPLDLSIEYLFDDHWSTCLCYTTFGGPYKYPYRVNGGEGKYRDAVVQTFSKGVELDLEYKLQPHLTASLGGGWNFGGWILIKNRHGTHGRYFKFNSAPYAQANIAFTF